MKIKNISTKHLIVTCIIILISTPYTRAQFVTTGVTNDVLAQPLYNNINSTNNKMLVTATANATALAGVQTVVFDELAELGTYSPMLLLERYKINQFIRKESYEFIKEKYPILKPNQSTEFLKNSLLRKRFKVKLESEYKKADSYLALDNYISEGDRILLLLSSLETVIKTCIEHEAY